LTIDYIAKDPKSKKNERNLKIYKLKEDGLSLSEIAKIFGITRQRVDQIINPNTIKKISLSKIKNNEIIENILKDNRRKEIVFIRDLISIFLRDRLGLSYQIIGKIMGKNHTSIMHAVKKIKKDLESYAQI
jgi:chromosomal replication initiation ATPase DnaA